MRRPTSTAHQAASLGYEIYASLRTSDLWDSDDAGTLSVEFRSALRQWGLDDLLSHQMQYAIRLAEHPSELLYEEMHKLYSLCDEIRALQELGLVADEALTQKIDAAVARCFQREARKARLVAEDRLKGWKSEWWWYATVLEKE